MKQRVFVILACATVFAACLSYVVYQMAGARVQAASPPISLAEIIVASHDIGVGSVVGPGDVKVAKWYGSIPKGAAVKANAVLHRGVVSRIYEGEPILTDRLSAPGAGGGLAATIPPGYRACAVKVNDVVGVAGFVVPGMRVDVLVTGVPPGAPPEEGPRVRTLLQNIQVLSAGTNLQKDNEGKPQQVQVVNLLVTPLQAESLSLAGNEAHIQLVLRNPTDTQIVTPPGTAMSRLFDVSGGGVHASEPARHDSRTPAPAAAAQARAETIAVAPAAAAQARAETIAVAPAAPPIRVVEVINGLTHSDVRFPIREDYK